MLWNSLFLAAMGAFLFPPFVICLFATSGDLNTCSLGIWGNGYKDPDFKCLKKTEWAHPKLTDAEALCYYNRYKNSYLSQYNSDMLCEIKIEWDEKGFNSGRNSSC